MGDEKCLSYTSIFVCIFLISIIIADDVRNLLRNYFGMKKKGQASYLASWNWLNLLLAQISTVMVFNQELTYPQLGGMPLFLVFAFMNAFILTVIYEEVFIVLQINNNY